ncbi:tRNA1(Val) (adenine(37)-N6)-methyltransferase [Desulfuromonas thiophila]|uniref:tRNA1Val (Adenine37-N6)-methyltransferase n=1 Tax=Desulfuromonas thiophila TaxID=57664 RepID=A0A1G6YHB6_9BACT|nr:methyltransferase [Desulfuromonas thiophila]SDD89758.1 tRNA1Val (adenine37-N6)-methyltransferase [Desulfuromonas thiophila]
MEQGQQPEAPETLLAADETLDSVQDAGLRLIQPRQGYRFSFDPLVLCDFARLDGVQHLLDLGCGCGLMALLAARRQPALRVTAIEVQPAQADRARRNVCLNGLESQVRVVCGDVRQWAPTARQSCDLVLCNPPFRPAQAGRQALDAERRAARHEQHGTLAELLSAAGQVLSHGGRCALVHLAERLTDVLEAMRRARLEPKRLRLVHSRAGQDACLVLVEGRKGSRPGLRVQSPLLLQDEEI